MNEHKAAFVFSEAFLSYKFRDDHPFNQKRVVLTSELLKASGALDDEQVIAPRMATDEEINLIHKSSYIEAVQKASVGMLSEEQGMQYGIGTQDTPIFEHMHEALAQLVGGTLTAVDAVMEGDYTHAVNIGGGLHHGFKGKASGFCIYNDAAIAIKYIREHYNLKVLYVDTDAHHGDGVQWAFYDDPNVCTFSIHETGRYLFPGTGNVNERGHNDGFGYSFNLPIDAFTEDDSFLEVYSKSLEEVTEYFRPDIIISQNGADAHAYDPLTHLCCSMKIFEEIPKLVHRLAHKFCNGKWVALGGGGYDIWRVVPRAWAQLWNVANLDGKTLQGPLPEEWLEKWQSKSPVKLPTHWQDLSRVYKEIPRKKEITEKNQLTLGKSLEIIRNEQKYIL